MGRYDLTLYYFLKDRLKVVYKTSSDDETYIRCPFCGDSRKDSRKARFYINNTPPFKFHCFNCETSGIINDEVLNLILNNNFYDDELSLYLREKRIESIERSNRVTKKIKIHPYLNLSNPVNFNYKRKTIEKLDYLNDRLGINLDKSDIKKFKIVLSIESFFKNNGLDIDKRIGRSDKVRYVVDELEKHYIGFLSSDRNIIIFRNIENDAKIRFNNFKIFTNEEYDTSKTYNISTTINKYNDRNNIVIAEGPIDIISIYHNVYSKKERENLIFLANGGKSYINSVRLLSKYSLINNHYDIMSDTDVDIDFYKRVKSITPELACNEMSIYYNKLYKDFGVSKNKIHKSGEFII